MWGIALGLAGTALGAWSAYQQGQAQADYLRQQSKLDNQRADEYLLRVEKNIGQRTKQASRVAGAQKTLLADSGVDVGFGVSLDLLEETYESLAEEVALTREEAAYQALSIRSGADAMLAQAKDASSAGTIGAVASLLGGASRFIK